MAWGESKVWQRGTLQSDFYRRMQVDAAERPARNSKRRRLVKPDEMPWEVSPHGLLKRMVNEQLNTRAETIDIYMQVILPGSRSGRHRHFAEEAFYVSEGAGYDLREFRVHGSVYTDAEVFGSEMDRIYERTWVYAGH